MRGPLSKLKAWRERNREYALQRALYKQGHPGSGPSPGMTAVADEGHGSGPALGYGRDRVETDEDER